jgi:hypothetical protein
MGRALAYLDFSQPEGPICDLVSITGFISAEQSTTVTTTMIRAAQACGDSPPVAAKERNGARISGGCDLHFGHLSIGPIASLQYTYVNIDGFSENGSLTPLQIHSGSAESLRSDFDFRAFYNGRSERSWSSHRSKPPGNMSTSIPPFRSKHGLWRSGYSVQDPSLGRGRGTREDDKTSILRRLLTNSVLFPSLRSGFYAVLSKAAESALAFSPRRPRIREPLPCGSWQVHQQLIDLQSPDFFCIFHYCIFMTFHVTHQTIKSFSFISDPI